MKRFLFYIVISIGCLFASCDAYSPDNGDLDGLWQLAEVDTLATGGHADVRARGVSWAFQDQLMVVRNVPDVADFRLLFHFVRLSDELVLKEPHESQREVGDIPLTDAAKLYYAGISRLEEHYQIILLNSQRMILQSDGLCLYFRKY